MFPVDSTVQQQGPNIFSILHQPFAGLKVFVEIGNFQSLISQAVI